MNQHLFQAFLLFATVFISGAAEFPTPYNSEPDKSAAPPSPAESLALLKLPDGFKATVFAAEPDVQNPIAMTWDTRGRLWIAENYTYAERGKRFDLHLRDRVLVFEDAKGDGHFSARKVFTDDVQMLTSIEVGHGGVWLLCPPQLLFIPDKNGDGIPSGAPEVVLDGFTVPPENYHNFANGLRFGPDGWLYGRCGASAPGDIGAPGTAKEARVPLRGTMWRYHPQRKTVEVLTSGTTNPWGHDWNEHGELFFINTVNGHLWHMIPGAHYVRPHTYDPNPRAYGLIDLHADHWHFDTAKSWGDSRDGKANAFGGGHAHSGMMIYQGDNWPAAYHGKLLTLNLHGRRANVERLDREGSGYTGRHEPDILFAGDTWFRGLELSYGPDGGVFVLDWSDTGECHESTGVHRTSGRIFKVTYGDAKLSQSSDLTKLSVLELVKLHVHANEWFSRQARLQLIERSRSAAVREEAKSALLEIFAHDADVVHKLRALWTLYVIGAAEDKFLVTQLRHPDEHIRGWAIRLLTDRWPLDTLMSQQTQGALAIQPNAKTLAEFRRLAHEDASASVRLTLASTLQRLPVAHRAELAGPLLAHAEDANDHNLPIMVWYGLIPVGDADPNALVKLAAKCELPLTRRFIARRLGEDIEKNPTPLNELLKVVSTSPSTAFHADILTGLSEGLTGWRKAKAPLAWDKLSKKLADSVDPKVRERVRDLSVLFGDGRALDEVRRVAFDKDSDLPQRRAALQTLIESRPAELRKICEDLLNVKGLNTIAVRGLAQFDDPAIGEKLAKSYRNFAIGDRPPVMDTLAARPAFAKPLLQEVAAGRIQRSDLTPFHARQIRGFNDAALTQLLTTAWGELRDSAADKQQFIAKLKKQLTADVLAKADKSAGRELFNLACSACHTLYGHGGAVGPDLTGAGRDNLDYLLDNIADPSAVVSADFRMTIVNLKDGRTINGLLAAKTDRTITLKTMTETVSVERTEIKTMEESSLSLMPEGLLEAMKETQVRDLIAYLMHKSQVPLPTTGK